MPCCSNSVRSPLRLPSTLGSVTPRNSSGMRFSSPAVLHRRQRRQRLHQGLWRAARLGDDDEAHPAEVVERMQRRGQRVAVEIVVEARARPPPLRLVGRARNVPAAELGQRLPAQARPAGAEEDDGARALGEPGEGRLGLRDVGRLLGDAQVRQAPAAVVLLEAGDGRRQLVEPARQLRLGEAVPADGAVEAAGDRLPVEGLPAGAGARLGRIVHHGASRSAISPVCHPRRRALLCAKREAGRACRCERAVHRGVRHSSRRTWAGKPLPRGSKPAPRRWQRGQAAASRPSDWPALGATTMRTSILLAAATAATLVLASAGPSAVAQAWADLWADR